MNTAISIPTFSGSLNGEQQTLINARDLHQFLDVGCYFTKWIKGRIKEYGFTEKTDYTCSPNFGSKENQGLRLFWGGHNRIDYHLFENQDFNTAWENAKDKQ